MAKEDIYQMIQKLKKKSKTLQVQIEAYELLLEDMKITDRKNNNK